MTLGIDPMMIPYCKLMLVISSYNNETVELKVAFVLRWQLVGMTDLIIYQLCDLGQVNIF